MYDAFICIIISIDKPWFPFWLQGLCINRKAMILRCDKDFICVCDYDPNKPKPLKFSDLENINNTVDEKK